jgi:molybdopterin synthase sulfur carrier subunit
MTNQKPRGVFTMAVQVKIPTILRTYTGGEKAVTGDGSNLSALLDDLETRHAGLKGRLLTDDGALHRFVNVYVNDEDVRFTGSLETALSDGDSVTILPAVAGGSRDSATAAGGSRDSAAAGGSRNSATAGS